MNDVTFGKLLSSVMLDNKYDRFVKNRRTGKLDTRSLYKIETSSKLFKRREARKNKDYAVSLVVDCSGSMNDNGKIEMAGESAQKLSKHLSVIGIPHNIITFACHVKEIKEFGVGTDKLVSEKIVGEVNRDGINDVYLFWNSSSPKIKNLITGEKMYEYLGQATGRKAKNFLNDKLSSIVGYTNLASTSSPGYNSDAEALMFARNLLLKQKGKKIMIFLSDGLPAPFNQNYESPNNRGYSQCNFDLKKEVNNTIKSGIELYSIGVQSDAVNRYYPAKRTCSIREIDQLYPHIIKLIKINLKRG